MANFFFLMINRLINLSWCPPGAAEGGGGVAYVPRVLLRFPAVSSLIPLLCSFVKAVSVKVKSVVCYCVAV